MGQNYLAKQATTHVLVTRRTIFAEKFPNLKFTPKMRQNKFGPDPLVELKRSSGALAAMRSLLLREEERVEREGEGRVWEGVEGKHRNVPVMQR